MHVSTSYSTISSALTEDTIPVKLWNLFHIAEVKTGFSISKLCVWLDLLSADPIWVLSFNNVNILEHGHHLHHCLNTKRVKYHFRECDSTLTMVKILKMLIKPISLLVLSMILLHLITFQL